MKTEIEHWRFIPNYMNRYRISNLGKVESMARDIIITTNKIPQRALKYQRNPKPTTYIRHYDSKMLIIVKNGNKHYVTLSKNNINNVVCIEDLIDKIFKYKIKPGIIDDTDFTNISNYEDLYKINKNKEIMSLKRNILLKPINSTITLCKDGKKERHTIDEWYNITFNKE